MVLSQVTESDVIKGKKRYGILWKKRYDSKFGGSQLQRNSLMSRTDEYFGKEIVVLLANMVVFREVAPNLITLVNTKDDDDFHYALKVVAIHTINEVRDIDYDPTIYKTVKYDHMPKKLILLSCRTFCVHPNVQNTMAKTQELLESKGRLLDVEQKHTVYLSLI